MPTIALVTGASRGIGEGIVRALRARDLEVHALALDDDDLQRVAAETGAIAHGIDIRDTAALEAAIADVPFDLVINNAGVLPELRPFQDNTAHAIDLLVDVNLRSALHVTRLVLPGMIARDRGHIFYLGSIAGRHPTPNTAVYAATKAALHAFAEGLRADLLGSAIRVTVLLPGRVQTRLYDGVFGDNRAASAALYDGFEAVQPSDIAAVIETAIDLPPHVDLTAIEILPTGQVFGGSRVAPTRPPEAG
ncbi:MAG TPA: SDR family oxidoreductase [Candidatus Limnocylindrales bacterium]|jgi:NADP-dependent 3-hydroxy acid dehydrogenase YdfG|nr:SDR family oxidoreductase [Candidatus Limnocylindrales bacterium]